jgi:hypothetical protein
MSVYILKYLECHLRVKIIEVYLFQEYVNFGYRIFCKIHEGLG